MVRLINFRKDLFLYLLVVVRQMGSPVSVLKRAVHCGSSRHREGLWVQGWIKLYFISQAIASRWGMIGSGCCYLVFIATGH